MDERMMISNPVLMKKSLMIIGAVVWIHLNGVLEIEPSVIALAGSFLLYSGEGES